MRAFAVIACLGLATVAVGFPSVDEAVPETELIASKHVDDSSFEAARQTVASLQSAGKSDSDCRKLATDSKKEISASVTASEKVLDALPDGSKCVSDHDDSIDKAQGLKDTADQAAKDAQTKVTKMCDVKVDFGEIHLDELKPGECDVFYEKVAYTKAAKDCADAKKAKESADGAKDEAEKNLKKVKEQEEASKKQCLCAVQKQHAQAWKDASTDDDANAIAWTKAHHIECVLDGTPADKCKVSTCPKAKKPTMVAAAEEAVCVDAVYVMAVTGKFKNAPTKAEPKVTVKGSKGSVSGVFGTGGEGKSKTSKVADGDIGLIESVTLTAVNTDGWYYTKFAARVGEEGTWVEMCPKDQWLDGKPYDKGADAYHDHAYSDKWTLKPCK